MTTAAAPADNERVACPSCGVRYPYAILNEHLDQCLLETDRSPVKRTAAREPPPKRERTDDAPSTSRAARTRVDTRPFSERMRPRSLSEYVGQTDVVQGALAALLRRGHVPSMVLWGPPGSGKTTLARLLTREAGGAFRFVEMSATVATVSDVKKAIDDAAHRQQLTGQQTVLFIDEIQRFNRAQQDIFLPALERGHITLVAATTENPSFRLQGALLSRLRVVVLTKLSEDECYEVLRQALARVRADELDESPFAWVDDALLRWIARMADGDARASLHALELAVAMGDSGTDTLERLKRSLRRTSIKYGAFTNVATDKTVRATHTTIPSAHSMYVVDSRLTTQKSIRGSDPNAALYWLARMVKGGDDPLFIARRLIVCASEDCCSAHMLQLAVATYRACEVVGLPECGINLSHCVVALAECPKSTRSYRAWKKALSCVEHDYNVRRASRT